MLSTQRLMRFTRHSCQGLTSTIGATPIIWGVRVDTYYWQGHP